jgi:hypothetical protein
METEKVVMDFMDDLSRVAQEQVQKLPGPEATPDPVVAQAQSPQEALEAALASMSVVLQAQAQDALTKLASLSEKLAKEGATILAKMVQISALMLSGKLDKASAELAIDNYLAALQLLGMAEVNAAKVQAFLSAQKTLSTLKSILLALIQVGVGLAAPYVGAWVGSLKLDQILDSILTPPPKS